MSESPQSSGRNWQRNATQDLWERTLNQIATKIGKMAYLSRLRNPETDRYEHHGLMAIFGEEAAEDALRRSHVDVLEDLLALSILDQKDDIQKYLEGLPQSARRLLANWEKTKGYEALLPPGTTPAQRELFEGNMGLVIRHLKSELAGGEKHPGS
jgi:hypothetical protein